MNALDIFFNVPRPIALDSIDILIDSIVGFDIK